MAINPEIHTFIQKFTIYMFEEVSSINHEWRNSSTSKPSKLVTVTGCRESMGKWHHDMPQHSAILRSPSHTPGLGTLVTNLVVVQIDVRDGRVCLQRLGQGLETETDQGWRLHPGLYRSNRDHWNPENTWHLTLTCESLWYRTWQTMQKSTVAYSIYIFDNSPWIRDEWWNYRTSKPSKLVTVKGCRKHMKTEAFSGGLYRHNLITEILRDKYMQIWTKIHLTQTCESLWCET